MSLWKNKLLAYLDGPQSNPFRDGLSFGVPRSRGLAEGDLKVRAQSVMRRFGTSADVWTPAQRGETCEYQLRDDTRIFRDSPLTR